MNKSRQLTEGALLSAIYIVLFLIVFFIPLIQIVGIFVLPVPFTIFAARHGWRPAFIMAIVVMLLTVIFATIISLPMALLASIGGIVIGNEMYKRKNAYDIWAKGTVAYIVSFVFVLALLQFVFSFHIFDEINLMIDETMSMVHSVMSQLQLGADMESQLNMLEERMRQFPDLLPSTLIIMSIIFALITQWMSYKILNRIQTGQEKWSYPPLKQLNLPPALIWLYFLVFLVSFMDMESDSTMGIIIMNAMAILSVLLIIQGFSFIFFFADYKSVHKAVPVSAVVISLVIPFIFMFIVEITGIIDLGFSLKKRISEQKS